MRTPTAAWPRAAAIGLLFFAAVAAATVLFSSVDDPYEIEARFENAGQLVEGGEVRVAGRTVGTISEIGVSDDGLASIKLSIDDDSVSPLHEGTRATIRAIGQAGVANRFVELSPGPAEAPELGEHSVLPLTQTAGIVDLDALLDTFDPATRRHLSALIRSSDQIFAGSGSRRFNSMLAKLDPALAESGELLSELAADEGSLRRLVATGAQTATAVASRSRDLEGAVVNAARTFDAIASEREALGSALERAPAVLRQARGTLDNASEAVTAVRPALREVPPIGKPLRAVLKKVDPALGQSAPVVNALRAQVPGLRDSLAGLAPLEQPAVDALRSLAPAVESSLPILEGLRYYGTDFNLGVTNGLAGILSANYNHSGHYGRLNFVESPQTLLAGLPAALLKQFPLVPGVLAIRTGLDAPCPGAGAPPAPDGSNPWIPDPSLCDPDHSIPASVNEFP